MGNTDNSPETEHLSASECWAYFRLATTGRVAVIRDGVPDIFPVNHIVDRGTIIYRTGPGALFHATLHQHVAFEVDGQDLVAGQAWSAVVRGRATESQQITDIVSSLDLPIAPWQQGPKPRFVRIEPLQVTGRRFTFIPAHPRTEPPQ